MSENKADHGLGNFIWVARAGGVWLGICITMYFIYPPDEQYNDIIKHCGDSSAFCACQAQAVVDQRSFLSQPLLLVGLKTYRKVAPMCAQYR